MDCLGATPADMRAAVAPVFRLLCRETVVALNRFAVLGAWPVSLGLSGEQGSAARTMTSKAGLQMNHVTTSPTLAAKIAASVTQPSTLVDIGHPCGTRSPNQARW